MISALSSLLSKGSSSIFTKSTEITAQWIEHFPEFLNHVLAVDETIIHFMLQIPDIRFL